MYPPILLRFVFGLWLLAFAHLLPAAVPTSPPPAPPSRLLGLTHEQILDRLGPPAATRTRADGTLLLSYADSTKLELREGRVVAATASHQAEIIGADGTRYYPGADGNIRRVTSGSPAKGLDCSASASAVRPPDTTAEEEDPFSTFDQPAGPVLNVLDSPGLAESISTELLESAPSPEPPPGAAVLNFALLAVLRLGAQLLLLRLTFAFMEMPVLWGDLLKVAFLNFAVHQSLSFLGQQPGVWELIPVFRVDSVVSYLILACSLKWFKIASCGVTALKIASATSVVLYFLMLGLAVAVSFALPALVR